MFFQEFQKSFLGIIYILRMTGPVTRLQLVGLNMSISHRPYIIIIIIYKAVLGSSRQLYPAPADADPVVRSRRAPNTAASGCRCKIPSIRMPR